MRWGKTLAMVGAVSMVLVVTFAAHARHLGHRGADECFGPHMEGLRTLLQLDLSDEQKSELLNILNRYKAESETFMEDMMVAGEEMKALRNAQEFNEGQVREAFRKLSSVREELLVLGAKMMEEMKGVLSDEQIKFLKEHRDRDREMMRKRFR
jgi:Spy/CpxP family protein refolding chaperone